jgi:glycolate oxidase iron-sulfur subunit
MMHAGREPEAIAAARQLIDLFERANVDQIAINAAGCGSAMKEYGVLLRDDPEYAERARAFAAKCVDVTELLAQLEPRALRHPVPLTVAYHDACHLQHAQRIKAAPRQLLKAIPGLDVREIPESDICCGSAGIYNLLEPEAANALRERKVANIAQTGAAVVVSGNPGCAMQIRSGFEAAGRPMPCVHTIELIDAAIRGRFPAEAP